MREHPKHVKKLIRDLLAEAYERELQRELLKLDRSFAAWRAGQIGSGELSHRVHQYDSGPSRELFKRYNTSTPDLTVAYAIVTGILKREEIPPEVLAALSNALAFYVDLQQRDDLRHPDDL